MIIPQIYLIGEKMLEFADIDLENTQLTLEEQINAIFELIQLTDEVLFETLIKFPLVRQYIYQIECLLDLALHLEAEKFRKTNALILFVEECQQEINPNCSEIDAFNTDDQFEGLCYVLTFDDVHILKKYLQIHSINQLMLTVTQVKFEIVMKIATHISTRPDNVMELLKHLSLCDAAFEQNYLLRWAVQKGFVGVVNKLLLHPSVRTELNEQSALILEYATNLALTMRSSAILLIMLNLQLPRHEFIVIPYEVTRWYYAAIICNNDALLHVLLSNCKTKNYAHMNENLLLRWSIENEKVDFISDLLENDKVIQTFRSSPKTIMKLAKEINNRTLLHRLEFIIDPYRKDLLLFSGVFQQTIGSIIRRGEIQHKSWPPPHQATASSPIDIKSTNKKNKIN